MIQTEIRPHHPSLGGLPLELIAATLTIASIAGGFWVWRDATSDVWLRGGVPVQVSNTGHAIFFCLGAVLGLPGGAVGLILGRLVGFPGQIFILPAMAIPLGCFTACIGFYFFAFGIFFAMPQDLFDLLTK